MVSAAGLTNSATLQGLAGLTASILLTFQRMKHEPESWIGSIDALKAREMMNPVVPNVLTALLGLLSVVVFTRLFTADNYGVYMLGIGFASVIGVAMIGSFRSLTPSEDGKNDGSDIRGLVLSGYVMACLGGSITYGVGGLAGLLLAVSGVTDRFVLANLIGAADAGKYVAGLELVRHTVMMPAIGAAAAFFPIAVLIRARYGEGAVRAHLGECAELLFSITLPACLGLAMIAPHIANVVLGVDFGDTAAAIMPVIAFTVLFQVLTQQYLHVSFLLSGRTSFYLINTLAIIAVNVALSYLLIEKFGLIGAAWGRLGADAFGFACALILSRRTVPAPLPTGRMALVLIAGLVMALVVGALDRNLQGHDLTACMILTAAGLASYAALCWAFDIARFRARCKTGLTLFRARLAGMGGQP